MFSFSHKPRHAFQHLRHPHSIPKEDTNVGFYVLPDPLWEYEHRDAKLLMDYLPSGIRNQADYWHEKADVILEKLDDVLFDMEEAEDDPHKRRAFLLPLKLQKKVLYSEYFQKEVEHTVRVEFENGLVVFDGRNALISGRQPKFTCFYDLRQILKVMREEFRIYCYKTHLFPKTEDEACWFELIPNLCFTLVYGTLSPPPYPPHAWLNSKLKDVPWQNITVDDYFCGVFI